MVFSKLGVAAGNVVHGEGSSTDVYSLISLLLVVVEWRHHSVQLISVDRVDVVRNPVLLIARREVNSG